MDIVFMIFVLILTAIINALIFIILINGKISFRTSFRLTSSASALNKILFTGSGYLASSYFSRNKSLSFHNTFGAFFLMEFLGVSFWLILGIYFGAKLAVKIPWFIIPILIVFVIAAWFKKDKLIGGLRNALNHFKKTWVRIIIVMPFVAINMALFVFYYFFIFDLYGFHPSIINIVKIVSVSFTVGYLSPAPAGAGFKDTGLVLLLINSGLTFTNAVVIAVFDRVFVTVFWGLLGGIFGYSLIKEEIKRRFKKNRSNLSM